MSIHKYLKEISLEIFAKRHEIDSAGLIGGKMGFCINVYELGRTFSDNELIALGDTMLDEVFSLIQTETTIDFSSGIVGIGWGIEHLVQNEFVDADTNEILLDLDNRLFTNKLVGSNNSLDLQKGFLGLGFYFIKRLRNERSTDESMSVLKIKQNLIGLIEQLDWAKGVAFQNTNEQNKDALARPLPLVFTFIKEVHELNLYNSRLNKIIHWFARHKIPVSDSPIAALQFMQPLLNVNKLFPADNLFSTLISDLTTSYTRQKIFQDFEHENAIPVLEVFRAYNSIVLDNARLFEDECSFWKEKSIAFLEACSGNYKAGNALEQANSLRLLDGFNGFYKILPAILATPTTAGHHREKFSHL